MALAGRVADGWRTLDRARALSAQLLPQLAAAVEAWAAAISLTPARSSAAAGPTAADS